MSIELAQKYTTAKIFPREDDSLGSIRVIVKESPGASEGYLIQVADPWDAHVYLGCWCDANGRILELLEVWVQCASKASAAEAGRRSELTNPFFDQRWAQRLSDFRAWAPNDLISTRWELNSPLPAVIDPESFEPFIPYHVRLDESANWSLCRDDALLSAAGLPAYSESRYRYLYVPNMGSSSEFVATDPDAPSNSRVLDRRDAFGPASGYIALNLEGGYIALRKASPISLNQFARALDGEHWEGFGVRGQSPIADSMGYERLQEASFFTQNHGLLLHGRQGREGRLLEAFHLKLVLIRELAALIGQTLKAGGAPFFNLESSDFGIRLHMDLAARLPSLWRFSVSLNRGAEALALNVSDTREPVFRSLRPSKATIYSPESSNTQRQGVGDLRVRDVFDGGDSGVTLEATLEGVSSSEFSKSCLVSLAIPSVNTRFQIVGRPTEGAALRSGEIRFRSTSLKLEGAARDEFMGLKGVAFRDLRFEIQPEQSSPVDLHALGVIALEILFNSSKIELSVAVDELKSLGRSMGQEEYQGLDAASARTRVIESQPRFQDSLGPQNATADGELTYRRAIAVLPETLWWETLDCIQSLFPGLNTSSLARDLGDANPFALEAPFEKVVENLDELLEKSRSLLLPDWTLNREVASLLENLSG